MALIEVKVPDIGDFKDVAVIEILVKPGDSIALEQSLIGGTDRTSYMREADVSLATASNDFRRLLDAGLIVQSGKGRTTRYNASESLRAEAAAAVKSQH